MTAQDTAHAAAEVGELLQAALGDRYDVLRPLGRGGMGFVFLAREAALDRLVAIKVAIRAPGGSADALARFRREARLAASLEHPGIVRVYAVGDEGDLTWFAMEYVDGPTLEQFIRTAGPLAPARLVQLLRELSDALAYAHARGIVHRDVKPANVLLAVDGRFLLTDFGIAKQHDEEGLTTTGRIIGTPAYMSPEQFRGGAVTAASDQYSLGGVLVFAATGRAPFDATDIAALIRAHLLDAPPSVRADNPSVPVALDTVVTRMMAKQPSERFGALTEVLPALLGDGRDLVDDLATPRSSARRPRVRIAVAVVVVGATAIGVAVWQSSTARRSVAGAADSVNAIDSVRQALSSTSVTNASDSASSVPMATTTNSPKTPPAPSRAAAVDRSDLPRKGETSRDQAASALVETRPAPSPPLVAAVVRVGSRISGAVLHVNDRAVDVLAEPRYLNMPSGMVRLSIRADRCVSWDSTVALAAGDTLSLGYRNPSCR